MSAPDSAGAIAYALNRLRTESPPEFIYHDIWHTEHEVMPAAVRLARLSGLPESEISLLEVAAAYHDIGLIETRVEHEQRGAEIATRELPRYGFGATDITRVAGMIRATRLPQSPRNLSEAILADADLDVLGREDFLARNRLLRQEIADLGRPMSDQEWQASQLAFLRQHAYFTPAAANLRGAGQRANLDRFLEQFQGQA